MAKAVHVYMKNKDAAKVDMKEYYENSKSPIKI